MGTRLGTLVERFGGELMGDPDLEVTGIAPLADAGVSHISFLSNSKLRAQARDSHAAALIVAAKDDDTRPGRVRRIGNNQTPDDFAPDALSRQAVDDWNQRNIKVEKKRQPRVWPDQTR